MGPKNQREVTTRERNSFHRQEDWPLDACRGDVYERGFVFPHAMTEDDDAKRDTDGNATKRP